MIDPQKTAVAPQGTAIAPQGTAVAPQGTAVAPQGTSVASAPASAPGKSISSGSQADIIVTDYNGRQCAMRLYKPGFKPNLDILQRLRKLNGKGLVADVLEVGSKDGRDYEIMPYYPLGSVADYDLRGQELPIVAIAVKTAMTLDALHKVHIIHKDIKPANLLVTDTDIWDTVLCDFGIADLLVRGKTSTPQSRTPIYAAPEMYDPKNAVARLDGQDIFEITPAADYYSLGMTILCLWYGEKAFMKKEQEMAVSKIKGSIAIPDDMPELLARMAKGLLERDPRKRWTFDDVKGLLCDEKLGEYGVKLFLNPLCDIRLNPDPKSPDYIATGSQIGEFLNKVYLWYFAGAPAPADEKLCDLVLDSFEELEDSYMDCFFNSKGEYLKDLRKCMERCLDNDYDSKKIAPTDPHVRFQISMMKTISSFGFKPQYTFPDTGETISSLDELPGVKADLKDALDHGLRGWIAVNCQEDPTADFSEPMEYESALARYVDTLTDCDPDCEEIRCYNYAEEKQEETRKKIRKTLLKAWFRRILQIVLPLIPAAASVPLALNALAVAKVDPAALAGILDHMWIFAIIGLAVGILVFFETTSILGGFLAFGAASFVALLLAKLASDYFMWVILGLAVAMGIWALVCLICALWPTKDAISPRDVTMDGNEAIVECLDYTFSEDEDYDPSYNGFLTDGRLYRWKDRLNSNRKRIIILFAAFAALVAASILLKH